MMWSISRSFTMLQVAESFRPSSSRPSRIPGGRYLKPVAVVGCRTVRPDDLARLVSDTSDDHFDISREGFTPPTSSRQVRA